MEIVAGLIDISRTGQPLARGHERSFNKQPSLTDEEEKKTAAPPPKYNNNNNNNNNKKWQRIFFHDDGDAYHLNLLV